MSASVDISKLMAGLRKGDAQTRARARQRMEQFAQHVLGDAQQITPVKTGALQASGTAGAVEIEGTGNIKAVLGFNTDYAAAVHERLDVHHEAPGQAKFLETAIRNNQTKLAPFVGRGLI